MEKLPQPKLTSEELAQLFGLLACLYSDNARDFFNGKRTIEEPLFEDGWETDHDFWD